MNHKDIRSELSTPRNKDSRSNYGYGDYSEFAVTYQPIKSGVFSIYLFGVIEDAAQFVSAIEVLSSAQESDIVVIHLSTPGGSLDATDTFIQAMRECEARIIVKASGGVHSAGSVILLNADEFTLSENFNCLIHNGSTGVGGKFSDFKAQVKHTQEYMEKVMRSTYSGFLSETEIEALLDGKDFWFDGEEFARRFEARNAILNEKYAEEQQAAMDSLVEKLGGTPAKRPAKPRKKRVKPVEQEAT